jgi:hypothetical protein
MTATPHASFLLTLLWRKHSFSSQNSPVFDIIVRERGAYEPSCLHAMDSDDEELSALDYARHYELCKPYHEEALYYGTLPVVTSDTIDQDLGDLSNESITNSVKALIKERFLVSRDAALLLNSIQKLQEAPVIENLTEDRHRWMLDLKQELPVLRTDAELDLLSFGDTSMPDLRQVNIPFVVIREGSDEGFEWPAKYLTYPAQCDAQIKAEKLVVSRDVLMHLQDAIRDSFTSQDLVEIDNESLRRKSVGEASILQGIAKNIEIRMSTDYPTPTSTITTAGALCTIIACESSSTSLRQR